MKYIQLKLAKSNLSWVVFNPVCLQVGNRGKLLLAEVTFDFVIAGITVHLHWPVGSVEREPVAGSSAVAL